MPDGDTIDWFRNILVKHGLQEKQFIQVAGLLTERGLILKKETIVDSMLISAPLSMKNGEKKRVPDAHSVKKSNTWHFGYKSHVGVDKDSSLVHHVEVTSANIHDVTMVSQLLSGKETTVYGDSGYIGTEKYEDAVTQNKQGKRIRCKTSRRPSQSRIRSARSRAQIKRREHEKPSVRAKEEHIFAVVKGLFHFRKRDTEVCTSKPKS